MVVGYLNRVWLVDIKEIKKVISKKNNQVEVLTFKGGGV